LFAAINPIHPHLRGWERCARVKGALHHDAVSRPAAGSRRGRRSVLRQGSRPLSTARPKLDSIVPVVVSLASLRKPPLGNHRLGSPRRRPGVLLGSKGSQTRGVALAVPTRAPRRPRGGEDFVPLLRRLRPYPASGPNLSPRRRRALNLSGLGDSAPGGTQVNGQSVGSQSSHRAALRVSIRRLRLPRGVPLDPQ
jgi:hypothetical protein